MRDLVQLTVNGTSLRVARGSTVAAAVVIAGRCGFRRSVTGDLRAPLCGMGICYECRVTINGVAQCRSCQIVCDDGMEVVTSE